MRLAIIGIFLTGLLCFTACSEDPRVFDLNREIENGVWPRKEVLHFPVEIKDSSQAYNLFYAVRNSVDYPFYNLYLRMVIKDTAGSVCLDHNHELYLFHPQTGEPSGKSGYFFNPSLGDMFDQKYPATFHYKFPYAGSFEVEISQFMRKDEQISGVYSVGFQVEKTTE